MKVFQWLTAALLPDALQMVQSPYGLLTLLFILFMAVGIETRNRTCLLLGGFFFVALMVQA
ncbi:hypothetical protein [Streptomyces acidicola]|uniref:hypothetical protein n=1 Tax=Streptomyces acidicola TaxID=2596892 RepID=UPI003813E3FC